MAEKVDIFMPMYWGDYDKDTSELSILEHGAYNLLIKEYWHNGGALPCDSIANALPTHDRLYRSCRAMVRNEQDAIDYILAQFFAFSAGKYHHERIDKELNKAREKRVKAKASAAARWDKTSKKEGTKASDANASKTHMRTQCSSPSPSQLLDTNVSNNIKKDSLDSISFGLFWDTYNYKINKQKAVAAFKRMQSKVAINILLEKTRDYDDYLKTTGISKQHPSTWLNGEGWENDYKQLKMENNNGTTISNTMQARQHSGSSGNGGFAQQLESTQALAEALIADRNS